MGRVQEVTKAYPEFAQLAVQIADPAHKNKYLMWIAAQLAKKHSQEDIKSTVSSFHKDSKRLRSSDIYHYEDLKTLENEIKDLQLSKRQVEIFSKEMGTVKIYADDSCTIVRINSKQAMLYYGKATRWCVAMENEEYWEDYSVGGNVFYVLLDKVRGKKFAIQKKGLAEVTVWADNDNEMDLDRWIVKNRKFESAIFACLHDRARPMLEMISDKTADPAEVKEWIKYQHQHTLDFMKSRMRHKLAYFLFDVKEPINGKSISYLSSLDLKELQKLQASNPGYIEDVIKYLKAHPKVKLKYFRLRLAQLVANPEDVVDKESASFIRMKKDPKIAESLLGSDKPNVWQKALQIASPDVVLKSFPLAEKEKRKAFLKKLVRRINAEALLVWISNQEVKPDNLWTAKAKSYYDESRLNCDEDGDEKMDEEEEMFD